MTESAPGDGARGFTFTRMIDLGVSIVPDAPHEPWKPKVHYLTHEGEGLDWIKETFGATEEDLVHSGGKGAAFEEVTAITHAGTHVDAPCTTAPSRRAGPPGRWTSCRSSGSSPTASSSTCGTSDPARRSRPTTCEMRWARSATR